MMTFDPTLHAHTMANLNSANYHIIHHENSNQVFREIIVFITGATPYLMKMTKYTVIHQIQ